MHIEWSDVSHFGDVVPLLGKDTTNEVGFPRSGINRTRMQKGQVWSLIFLCMQLQILKFWDILVNPLVCGYSRRRKYRRSRLYRLRFLRNACANGLRKELDPRIGDSDNEVLKMDINSILDNSTTRRGSQTSSLGSLRNFGTVNWSPEKMAKLQHQDSDVDVVMICLNSDTQRPSLDRVAGYSPYLRHYWLKRDFDTKGYLLKPEGTIYCQAD